MKIPQDVRLTVMAALMVPEHEMVDSVALAIIAERKRCADVARKYCNGLQDTADLILEGIEAGA